MNKGIEEAIHKAGGQTQLAAILDRKQPLVWKYLHGVVPVPVKVALLMEADRRLCVPRWKTRPDVWKEASPA